MPSGSAICRTCARWACTSRQVWCSDFSGAPESSNCPPGSSEIAPPPTGSASPMMFSPSMDRLPAEQRLHAFEQRADARSALIGHRGVAVLVEAELLVLRADPPLVARLAARIRDAPRAGRGLDRRRVGGVARHDVSVRRKRRTIVARRRAGKALYRQSPMKAWTSASAATAAVSARRMRGPSDSGRDIGPSRAGRRAPLARSRPPGRSAARPGRAERPLEPRPD